MLLCWACCLVKGKTSIRVPVQNQAVNVFDLFVASSQDQLLPVFWNMLGWISHCLLCWGFPAKHETPALGSSCNRKISISVSIYFYNIKKKKLKSFSRKGCKRGLKWLITTKQLIDTVQLVIGEPNVAYRLLVSSLISRPPECLPALPQKLQKMLQLGLLWQRRCCSGVLLPRQKQQQLHKENEPGSSLQVHPLGDCIGSGWDTQQWLHLHILSIFSGTKKGGFW